MSEGEEVRCPYFGGSVYEEARWAFPGGTNTSQYPWIGVAPCHHCLGAIRWSRVKLVVYAL
jgi:hypothetical protein